MWLVLRLGEEALNPVGGNGEGDPRGYLQSVDTDHLPVLHTHTHTHIHTHHMYKHTNAHTQSTHVISNLHIVNKQLYWSHGQAE